MKKPEYIEGEAALRNFQTGMRALFQATKQDMSKKKSRQQKKSSSNRKRSEQCNGKA